MELFEDFEFKPLTEGLGFHRNSSSPKNALATPSENSATSSAAPTPTPPAPPKAAPSSFAAPLELKEQKLAFTPALKPEYNFMDEESLGETKKFAQELTQPQPQSDRTKIYQPIGRKDYSPAAPVKPAPEKTSLTSSQIFSAPVPGAPASLSALRQQKPEPTVAPLKTATQKATAPSFAMNALTATATVTAPTLGRAKTDTKNLTTCLPAALLDGVFAFGMSTILLVIVLLITKADLIALLSNSKTDHFVQFQLGLLYLMVLQMYMLVSRSTLFGQSLGEWTYEIQLGDDQQRAKAIYPLQVVLRALIFALTGFILLPLLSLVFSQDLVAKITGLELLKKPYGQQ